MQVHLVTVKVGVVGRGVGQVHPEGAPGQDLHPVPHHTHLVEGGLPVEHHQVAVPDVPLHLVAALQVQVGGLGVEPQVDPLARVPDDVLGPGVLRVAPPHQGLHPVDVEGGDNLWEGQVLGHCSGHSHLVDPQVGVGRDDGPGAEIHTLAHQVTSDPALLPLQPRLDRLERPA